ncbi:MAG: succinate dehydrogenase [Leptolyngbya sp. PLA2]|nr:succinate dehydrogenase [Leptolyngbya sp.]MCE7972618.1 succinate dehydrogenase [Leptolyngbya sp. PL-A2]MCQ3941580.1 succinate dehydrogenase [cyanobacterium CYA1]MCZ7634567.1 hypothetical protein [Phycisphaerales bacterium]MDL1905837.1 succinate dehydrogenase [Synechococcales cyanobacterium CNB]GIK20563.1 MAG: succinate dehydrogenase [Planctomycetota bacterium]
MAHPWFERHYFLLRRLHSLSGVIPIGAFLIIHLTTNASIVWGRIDSARGGIGTFQHEVHFIHSLPVLLLTEIFVLWIPIAFHSILGFYYAFSGRPNVDRYRYQANRRYALQRLTGYIGFLFILYHVATLRWGWTFLVPGGTRWSHEYAASTLAAAIQGGEEGMTRWGLAVAAFYMFGVTALVFHFANGLWTAAITWGITISAQAQKRWGMVCLAIGAGLMALAWSAVVGFATLDPREARLVEEEVLRQRGALVEPGDAIQADAREER